MTFCLVMSVERFLTLSHHTTASVKDTNYQTGVVVFFVVFFYYPHILDELITRVVPSKLHRFYYLLSTDSELRIFPSLKLVA